LPYLTTIVTNVTSHKNIKSNQNTQKPPKQKNIEAKQIHCRLKKLNPVATNLSIKIFIKLFNGTATKQPEAHQ